MRNHRDVELAPALLGTFFCLCLSAGSLELGRQIFAQVSGQRYLGICFFLLAGFFVFVGVGLLYTLFVEIGVMRDSLPRLKERPCIYLMK